MSTVDLSNLLHLGVVKTPLEATGKFQALQELLGLLVSTHDLSVRQLGVAREALFRAERSKASGSPSGFAATEAVVDGLLSPVAALGCSPEGISFGSSRDAKVVLLTLLPSGAKGRQSSSGSFEILHKDAGLIDSLVACDSADQVCEQLKKISAS